MAIFSQYGTGQRTGLAIVCVAFSLCLIGSIAPFWISAQTSVKDLDVLGIKVEDIPFIGDLVGDVKLFEINIGIWWYCIDLNIINEGEKCYRLYGRNDGDGMGTEVFDGNRKKRQDYKWDVDRVTYESEDKHKFDWIQFARLACTINVFLALLCGLTACCRCLCCSGGRTICHGVMSFLSGISGLTASIVVYNHTKSLVNVHITNEDYDWAITMYIIGSIMMIIASLLLCFARPREATYGMVITTANPSISVNMTQSSFSQYNAGGQINSFEPLPHPSNLQNASTNPAAVHSPPPVYSYN